MAAADRGDEAEANTTTTTEGGDEAEANRHKTAGCIAAAAGRGDEAEANRHKTAGRIAAAAGRGDKAEANRHKTAGRIAAAAGRGDEVEANTPTANFEDIRSHFPVPVNEVLTAPMTVQSINNYIVTKCQILCLCR